MTQGLVLFDPRPPRHLQPAIYRHVRALADVVKPGIHLRDLILHRERGSFVGDVDAYCAKFLDPNGRSADAASPTPDGRTIRMIFKRSPDGGWASTMEDVTEGSRVQPESNISPITTPDQFAELTLFQRHAEGCC
jgi:hypothetical protein